MAVSFSPSLADINNLISRSQNVLDIISPYITAGPLDLLYNRISQGTALNVWTRLSPSDWVYGSSDPEFLALALDSLSQDREVSLQINQRLHAKAYFADRSFALLGSANFTENGFGHNIEVLYSIEGESATAAFDDLSKALTESRPLSVADLIAWVEDHRKLIEQSRGDKRDLATELREAQRDLDTRLGYGFVLRSISIEPTTTLMETFIDWLRGNTTLRESEMVIKRYENFQYLSGKAKQSICGVYRFLQEYPQLIDELAIEANKPETKSLYSPSVNVVDDWIAHINQHATDSGDCFDYAVLRGYLTPSFGGTLEGGTGGESTLKRVFPLMAAFLKAMRR